MSPFFGEKNRNDSDKIGMNSSLIIYQASKTKTKTKLGLVLA